MYGGRWDPQTRIAVVVVGLLVVTVGVLATVRWQSDLGAAALVVGGLLVGLAGVAGGTIFGPREGGEIRIVPGEPAAVSDTPAGPVATDSPAPAGTSRGAAPRLPPVLALDAGPARRHGWEPGVPAVRASAALREAYEAGDVERAVEVLIRGLRGTAPGAVAYHDAVCARVAAAVRGLGVTPVAGQLLGAITVVGLPIVIDIRAGAGFSPALMLQTYRTLFDDSPGVAILTVVNTADPRVAGTVSDLGSVLGRPVIALPWRLGDPDEPIAEAIAFACQAATGGTSDGRVTAREDASSGEPVAAVPRRRRPDQNCLAPPARPWDHSPGVDTDAWRHATDLHSSGRLHEAEEAYRAIAEARAMTFGREHPETLTARDQHATVLRDLDRLADAQIVCEEVLAARSRQLGAEHVDVLTSRGHLASIYHRLGDLTRAETEHGQVLAARTRLLGASHPQTLISRSDLARVYQDLGELDRAVAEHEMVLRERATLFGADHRDTLMSRSLLASALHLVGRLPEAEAHHRAVLGGRLRLFGVTHLDTAVSRHRLASVLHDLERFKEAAAEYAAARAVYATLLGESSPFARAAASDLAVAERALASVDSGVARRPSRASR